MRNTSRRTIAVSEKLFIKASFTEPSGFVSPSASDAFHIVYVTMAHIPAKRNCAR